MIAVCIVCAAAERGAVVWLMAWRGMACRDRFWLLNDCTCCMWERVVVLDVLTVGKAKVPKVLPNCDGGSDAGTSSGMGSLTVSGKLLVAPTLLSSLPPASIPDWLDKLPPLGRLQGTSICEEGIMGATIWTLAVSWEIGGSPSNVATALPAAVELDC